MMSARRRLALLAWARARGAWVLEDDYDGEFRYAGHPLPALQGLEDAAPGTAADRVLYLGTFSKTLFPAIRLAYLVAPPALVEALAGARAVADRYSPTVDQAVAAAFLERGWFARHLRRMRALYAERQAALLDAAGRELVGLLRLEADPGGMQLLGWLPPGVDADRAARAARARGVETLPLTDFYAEPRARTGQALMLGYAAVDAAAMRPAARRLAAALRPLVAESRRAARAGRA